MGTRITSETGLLLKEGDIVGFSPFGRPSSAVRRTRGVTVRATMAAALTAVAAAGAAGCDAAPAAPRTTASGPSHGTASPTRSATPTTSPSPGPPADMSQEVLRHLSRPDDAPDARGVTRVAPDDAVGHYFWETRGGRMCFATTASFPGITVDCGGPSVRELAHLPQMEALFGPGGIAADNWYLVFRVGHGRVTSLSLDGTSVKAGHVRALKARNGGGDAYFTTLPRSRGTLTATVDVGGRTTSLKLALGF